ncbi:MAG: branched-chain amino acid ABC transporter permease, partial [Oscillospiraceae bacterium]
MKKLTATLSEFYNKYKQIISGFIYKYKKYLLLALLAVLILLPLLGFSSYMIRVFCVIVTYSILAISLNLITGYMGQTSMGHAALYCIGAYAGALATTALGLSFWVSLLIAIGIGALAGAFEGFITMNLSGSYMTVTTLAFAQVTTMVVKNWVSLTNGPLGIKNIPRPTLFGLELTTNNGGLYWLGLFFLVMTVLFVLAIINSKMGRAVIAIKEDELAAKLMGIENKKYRIAVVAIAGAIAGVAGCYFAHMSRYIDPNVFSFDVSMTILTIVIFGGLASIPGSIVGAIIMIAFPEVLRFLSEYRFLVYGF